MHSYNFNPVDSFYYSIGNAKTDVPWFHPDPEYLNSWKEEFFALEESTKYRYFLHGGALINPSSTWDVDLTLSGPVGPDDYDELEFVMYAIRQLGFKHRQLIEPFWQDLPPETYSRPKCDHFQIACDTFMSTGACTLQQCLDTPAKNAARQRIRYGVTVVKNQIKTRVFNPELDGEILEHIERGELIITNIIKPKPLWTDKLISKMKNGFYKRSPVEITKDTNFRDIVSWP